ncbi:hypothetical protein DFH09DRAFT_945554 [Mycena vulgaris]|nr:hypothetical protein DFH09DRAFT_945554 [Mycena vulgaris]
MTTDPPPAFEPSTIDLQSVTDSKIVSVSLYSTRAEVTRLYKFAVNPGQNQVNISGLPSSLETESLRVEGRGAATIHDVTVSVATGTYVAMTSPKLGELLVKREKTVNALARCQKALASLEQYLGSLSVQHLEVSKLENMLESYEASGERLDAKKSELTQELRIVETAIAVERAQITTPHENDRLHTKAAIGVFAQVAGDVEIALIYAVPAATWTAFYDIRVDMDTKENPVTLIYKAAVRQKTGESWDDVPLQLETSTPTFGLGVPKLAPWNLNVVQKSLPRPQSMPMDVQVSFFSRGQIGNVASPSNMLSASADDFPDFDMPPAMGYAGASVTSKGTVSATFRVPGLVTIPSDDETHNFTIVELGLKAAMSGVSVPKLDAKTHLTVRTPGLIHCGCVILYVDGSFISRSDVPAVSPQESFDCPLGVDPSIRITYHPLIKKLTHSGFYTKSANYVFSQRITVHSTKGTAVGRLRVIDHITASQNAQIEVRRVAPALALPTDAGASSINLKAPPKSAEAQVVNVGPGVVAQWDGMDDPGCEVEALGLDRKVNWICAVPAQARINLALEWEVTVSPASAQVVGL